MIQKNRIKRAAAFLAGSAVLLSGSMAAFPASVSVSAADCVIDTGTTYQTIRGFGGINHPEWAGDLTSSQRETAFGNGPNQLGFTMLRVFVNPDKNQWNKAVATAKYASEHNVTVFASPWEPPSNLAESGGSNGKLHLPSRNYGAYATHLNDFGNYMKQNGVNLYSISVQNEPDYAHDWTYWSTDEAMNFIADYGDKITSTRLMSPESFQFSPDGASWINGGDGGKRFYKKIMGNAKAMANCDVFGTHYYGTTRDWMDYPDLENCGKELWMTEVYVPNSEEKSSDRFPEALAVAENIHNGMCVSNLSAYVWWYIRRQYGPMNEDGSVSKRGAMMAQYSKWIRPGAVRIAATEFPEGKKYVAMDTKNGNYGSLQTMVSAYKQDNQVTVVAINPTPSAKTQSFTLKSGETISAMEAYHTTGSENFRSTTAPGYNGSSFSASLPAQSVTTFVISTGEIEPEQPDADGYFFHDTFEQGTDNWEGRGGAAVASAGSQAYAGSKALAVSGREKAWNGAQKSLNSRTFVPGQEYSFSVNAMFLDGGATADFKLTLQYTGSDGDPHYSDVATATVEKGKWVQLANQNYKIPEGASNLVLYVEVVEPEGAENINFYIDEAIGAPGGTDIKGAGQPEVRTVIKGDVNFDGFVDSFDIAAARRGIINGFSDAMAEKAADVDGSGKAEIADVVLIQNFVLKKNNNWPEPVKPDNAWDDYIETASSEWITFYKNSICNMGNTYRLASKLSDAENGKSLTLAYLGGSITEGKKYSTPFSSYVQKTFAKGSFKEVNAGLSGTSSVVGLVRCDNEVLSQNPDIIFLEFSVNDHEDIMYKKSFESLVKKCLNQPNDPAVIILINRAKGGFNSQEQMAAIGKNFNVPVISMNDALTKAFSSGLLTADDYFTDEYHPHDKGGKLISDCLAYYFRQVMRTENRSASYSIPTTKVYGSEYSTCANADPSTFTNFNAGSFTKGSGYGKLPYGYTYNGGGSPMTFKTTGKGLVIVFKANSSGMGSVDVTVNGKTTKVNGNKQYTWGGPDAELGYYQDESGELNVSISGNGTFTIWGIGLIK